MTPLNCMTSLSGIRPCFSKSTTLLPNPLACTPAWSKTSGTVCVLLSVLIEPVTIKALCVLNVRCERAFFIPLPLCAASSTPGGVTYGGECGHTLQKCGDNFFFSLTTMADDFRALIAQLVSSQQDQQQRHELAQQEQQLRHEQIVAEQQNQTAIMRAELQGLIRARETQEADRAMSRINPARFIVKQTPSDDVEVFLLTFERTAQREDWPEEHWADLIAPFLTGIAQVTYQDLSDGRAVSFDELRTEILKRHGYTMMTRAQRLHEWRYDARASPRAQMHELTRLANSWLASGPNTLSPIERVVMFQFVQGLPAEARRLALQSNPQSAVQLVEMMEGYQAAQSGWQARSPPRREGRRQIRPQISDNARPRTGWRDTRRCATCGEQGHVTQDCRADVPMVSVSYGRAAGPGEDCALVSTVGRQGDRPPPTTPVKANGRDTTALLDSGSAVTLVRPEFVPGPRLDETVGVTCIHGDTREYPTARLHLQTTKGQSRSTVGVVDELPVPVLIGRDVPMFPALWRAAACGERASDGEKKRRTPAPRACRDQEVDGTATTEPMADGAANAAERENQDADEATGGQDVDVAAEEQAQEDRSGADERGWNELFPMNMDEPTLPGPLAGRFGTAQLEDSNLAQALRSVVMVDGQRLDGVSNLSYPYFVIKKKLLYQLVWVNGEQRDLLLIPRPFVDTVLHLAHTHLMGAHLGVEKTLERVRARFTWPGVKRAVEDYCRSCPDCQMVAPRPRQKAPLIPLPVIDVPFRRIAMDLVGPLPKSKRGHKYILVVLDYATRYPEAIPLRTMATKGIARELFVMFSRVGIPGEILTDQGTPFMSRIMKDLCVLLKVSQIRTSVYHPQTDGLVERFNQTLKKMLKKVIEKDGSNWDQLLPYVMFSIREVPQASTGFSPFELLYGRRPRGMLDIAKEAWEEQPSPHRTMVEHVEEVRERMATLWPIVRQHMSEAQAAQGRVYNRGAQPREFHPGDKVLVLVPTSECKFLARWNGPYEIIERLGEVNYRVRQPGRRHATKVYHVNMIKKWVAREALLSLSCPQVPRPDSPAAIPMGDQLTPNQKQEMQELVDQNQDVFSEKAGRTNLIQHRIVTEKGKKVKLRPYRIPEARRVVIREEVEKMLKAGVIEPSYSEWCSPVVLVPKPDRSPRFCNDFRQLNAISQFDAYPMPRVDELMEKLGEARYITTLDLTKGYWQVPLSPESREKTAFATPDGLFQYRMLPFGLHGAPATFQRLMDRVLRPHQKYAAAYLDDIVIHAREWDTHLRQIRAVLGALREAGLTANPKKCHLGLREADYLGYTIGRGCVRPQEKKVEAIRDWPRPQTKKQVRVFVGLLSYYRRFVPQFSAVAAPLTDLTRNRLPEKVTWTEETEKAFVTLKEVLCTKPVLVTPDFSKPLVVQTDASETGVGAVLSQLREGEEHPITYISRKLLPREQKYSTVEKECLAIKWALQELRYYLVGRRFTLVTDHAPLVWMSRNKENNARVTRWFLSLQNYAFSVVHRKGAAHGNADAMSRRDAMGGWFAPTRRSGLRRGVCGSREEYRRGIVEKGRYSPRWRVERRARAGGNG